MSGSKKYPNCSDTIQRFVGVVVPMGRCGTETVNFKQMVVMLEMEGSNLGMMRPFFLPMRDFSSGEGGSSAGTRE